MPRADPFTPHIIGFFKFINVSTSLAPCVYEKTRDDKIVRGTEVVERVVPARKVHDATLLVVS